MEARQQRKATRQETKGRTAGTRKDKEEKEGNQEEDIVNSSVHDIKLLYEETDWASLRTALGHGTESIKGKPGAAPDTTGKS